MDLAALPQLYRACPVPFVQRENVEQVLNCHVEKGTIDPVKFSQWAEAIVLVVKTNGPI